MIRAFVDTSVLFAAIYSAHGFARDLIDLSLQEAVVLVVCPLVLEEVERNIAKKVPGKMTAFQELMAILPFEVVPDANKEAFLRAAAYTELKDAPIVAAAIDAGVDYLVTYDRKHLLDRPEVAEKSGLAIVTPDLVVQRLTE